MTNFTDAELRDRIAKQQRQRECRDGYRQFLAEQRPHAFVTLTINRGARRLESMTENLAKWGYYMDCSLNNVRRVNKLSRADRLTGWFAPEKTDTNGHWHGLVRFPEWFRPTPWRVLQFDMIANHQWKSVTPGGNVHLEPIYDAGGATGYCLKEDHKGDDFYGLLTELSEFWPVSKPGRTR